MAPGALPDDIYIGIGIVGSGEDLDEALRSFLPYVQRQPRLKLIRLHSHGGTPGGTGARSNAQEMAAALRDMFERSHFSNEAGWH